MKTTFDYSLTVTKQFRVSADRVFAAWLNPLSVGEWLFATSGGKIIHCEVDPRPGGRFIVTDERDGEGVEHAGTVLEVIPNERFVFSVCVPKYSDEFARIEITIRKDGDGCVIMLNQQSDYPAQEQQREGWQMILDALSELV